MSQPTVLLERAMGGDPEAVNALFDLLYGDLHARARNQRRRWQGNLTMNTTALVHEAYARILDQDKTSWTDRAHFMAIASTAMRHVLIDYARRVSSKKRGGDVHKQSLEDVQPVAMDGQVAHELIDLERALSKLEVEHPAAAAVVECRFFGGMTVEETAEALGISMPTVKRRWALARTWLYGQMKEDVPGSD